MTEMEQSKVDTVQELAPLPDRIQTIVDSIQAQGLKGTLIQGGSSIYNPGNQSRDQDTWFIQPSRQELESFLSESSGSDLEKTFGFDPGSLTPFTSEELSYCFKENIEVVRLSGNIDGVKTTVKLVAQETLKPEQAVAGKRVLSKGKNKDYYERRAPDGSTIALRLDNECLNPDEERLKHRTYIIHDQNYYEFKDPAHPEAPVMPVAGLFTDFLVTSRIRAEFGDMNTAELQDKQLAQFALLTGLSTEDEIGVRKALVRGHKFTDAYASELASRIKQAVEAYDHEFSDHLQDASIDFSAVAELKRVPISSDNLFNLNHEFFSFRLEQYEQRAEREGTEFKELKPSMDQESFILIKPESFREGLGDLIGKLAGTCGLEVKESFEVRLPGDAIQSLYRDTVENWGQDVVDRIKDNFDASKAMVLVLKGDDALEKGTALKKVFRKVMGSNGRMGPFIHSPDSYEESERELEILTTNRYQSET